MAVPGATMPPDQGMDWPAADTAYRMGKALSGGYALAVSASIDTYMILIHVREYLDRAQWAAAWRSSPAPVPATFMKILRGPFAGNRPSPGMSLSARCGEVRLIPGTRQAHTPALADLPSGLRGRRGPTLEAGGAYPGLPKHPHQARARVVRTEQIAFGLAAWRLQQEWGEPASSVFIPLHRSGPHRCRRRWCPRLGL